MKIDADVLEAIRAARCEGEALYLSGQLEDRLYQRVNLALSAAGGRWDRWKRSHIFPANAADAITGLLAEGEVTTDAERGYFPTPPALVDEILNLADMQAGQEVLEPSAGTGAMAERIADRGGVVDCVELDPDRAEIIRSQAYARQVTVADFLTLPVSARYDRVVMNPPFAKQLDIRHVQRALRCVRPHGLLVAIMFAGLTFRTNPLAVDFRNQVREARGTITPLPDRWFRGIRTVLTVIPVRPQPPELSGHRIAQPPRSELKASQDGLF
ncbi:class I SAM-dependent methyltransferase [Streptomyces sp. DSM 40907]|uniref:class I SAM-dependent methyltransferase n=1 Tax=Streptomyces kutzneri TaxID=3051179 RepID=UPI0028D3A6B7|nr:class I SAM-dependent methyltransferase [Streptomyces sp. DSM 40907]